MAPGRQIDLLARGARDPGAAVPRVLEWALVKRIDPRLPNTWGHWWIELDDEESYGWWPEPCPMGWKGAMLGSRGCLNGIGTTAGGTPSRDAYHGEEPDHSFHPTLITDKSDERVREEIRAYAHRFVGGFRWQWWWLREGAENCRTFQDGMFAEVGLFEEPEYLYTRGAGCPFMYPFRQARWRAVDALAAAAAPLRGWSPASRGRRRQGELADGDGSQPARAREADLPLSHPRGRAQAKARGTLLPQPAEPLEVRDRRG